MTKLTDSEVAEQLQTRDNWTDASNAIQRTFQFKDFIDAMKFVNACADEAERVQHHPDILIRYNKVTLTLSTHDAGGVTEKDFSFAEYADSLNS